MKKYIFSGLLLMASTGAFAQMQVDKQIQMTGAAADDRRITGVSNASTVTPVASDAINIATFQSNYTNYGAATFATGTYTFALTPAPAQYWEGMIVSFKAGAINTGATNLNISTLGNRAIVKAGGQALVAGDIQANQMVTAVYNLTGTRFEIIGSGGIAGWSTLGNTGTAPATNFLGTVDAQSLVFRANNTERMRILSSGEVVVGATTVFTGDVFSSYAGATQIGVAGYATTGTGMYGQATGASGFGVRGISNQTTGLGVFGVNLATGGVGVQGQANTGAAVGVFGTTTSATNFATGVYGQAAATTTQTRGVFGIASSPNGTGVVGINNNPASANSGIGVMGAGNNSPLYTLAVGGGVYGNGIPYGVVSFGNRAADGWGVVGSGNDLGTSTITGGGGGAFNGVQWGVFGNATTTTNATDRAAFIGNFNSTGTTGSTVYVGARIGGVVYKILGAGGASGGSVSTTMQTREGERILFAPESPENWFFDIGEVQLVNGKAKIQLDPLFYDCISHEKPFKIFVQGAENTLGAIKIKARGSDWFELEDTGGASNGTVMFNIYAIWKGKENLRLPKFENPAKVIYQEKIKVADGNYQTKPSVQAQDIKK